MSVLDFPVATIIGQQYTGANGVTYEWNGFLWIAIVSGGHGVTGSNVSLVLGPAVNLNIQNSWIDVLSTGVIGNTGEKWLLMATFSLAHFVAGSPIQHYMSGRLWDGSNMIVQQTLGLLMYNAGATGHLHRIVLLSAPTNFKLQCNDHGSTTGQAFGGGTMLTAIRVS